MRHLPKGPATWAVFLALIFGLFWGLDANAKAVVRPVVPTASDLYLHMLVANTHYSYRGRETITYWNSGRIEAVIVSHLAPRLRRLDILSPERQEGAVFLSNGHEEWQYDPRTRQVDHSRLTPSAVTDPATNYGLLKAHYLVTVAPGRQEIDNRPTYLLTITAKKTQRVARKLWIDAATGLVLKEEWYEGVRTGRRLRDRLAVTEAFTDINFHPHLSQKIFDPTLLTRKSRRVKEDPAVPETSVPISRLRHDLGQGWLTPATLGGFHLVSAAFMAGSRLHLRYSDGLNSVSLFEQRRRQPRVPTVVPHSRLLRIGSLRTQVVVNAGLTAVNWDSPTLILSVVGEVPVSLRTLERFVQAVDARRP